VQVLFGYYVILQAKLSELEKKMRQRRRRQAVLRGGSRWPWAFERKKDDEMQHDVFRGENGRQRPWGSSENAPGAEGVKRMRETSKSQQLGNDAGGC
jgi:hypothetical protein